MIKKFLIGLTLIYTATQLEAQDVDFGKLPVADYKKSEQYYIKDISVSGIKFLDKNILINLSGLSIGQQIYISW